MLADAGRHTAKTRFSWRSPSCHVGKTMCPKCIELSREPAAARVSDCEGRLLQPAYRQHSGLRTCGILEWQMWCNSWCCCWRCWPAVNRHWKIWVVSLWDPFAHSGPSVWCGPPPPPPGEKSFLRHWGGPSSIYGGPSSIYMEGPLRRGEGLLRPRKDLLRPMEGPLRLRGHLIHNEMPNT